MYNLKKFFLKILYRLLIFKIIIVDRSNFAIYSKLNTFCELEIDSNMGVIKFIFKEDRRKKKRDLDNILLINNFLVELKVPDDIIVRKQDINEKVIIVIKFMLFKVDYPILAEVLLDIYLNSIIKYFKDQDKEINSKF
jgi:hypothetical protein